MLRRMISRLLFALLSVACAAGQGSGAEPVAPGKAPVAPAAPAAVPPRPAAPVAPAPALSPSSVVSPAPTEPPPVPAQVVSAPPEPGKPPPAVPKLEEWQKQLPGAVWPPPGWVPPACEVEVSTRAVRRGKAYDVVALAKNRAPQAVTLSLPSRCPQGPIVFHGLGDGYDYYRSCAKGACAGPRNPETFTIQPGKTVELAAIEVDPKGGGCTEPLPSGRHSVSFSVPFAGQVCAGTFAVVEGRAAPKPPPAKPAPKAPCPPAPTCGIACPGGEFARDANGCTTCGCVDRRGVLTP